VTKIVRHIDAMHLTDRILLLDNVECM